MDEQKPPRMRNLVGQGKWVILAEDMSAWQGGNAFRRVSF